MVMECSLCWWAGRSWKVRNKGTASIKVPRQKPAYEFKEQWGFPCAWSLAKEWLSGIWGYRGSKPGQMVWGLVVHHSFIIAFYCFIVCPSIQIFDLLILIYHIIIQWAQVVGSGNKLNKGHVTHMELTRLLEKDMYLSNYEIKYNLPMCQNCSKLFLYSHLFNFCDNLMR